MSDPRAVWNTELLASWQAIFGETPMIAHVVREQHPRRWVRIHSLPQAKRYAESAAEYAEILLRQNTVADEVIGAGMPCALVTWELDAAVVAELRAAGYEHTATWLCLADDAPVFASQLEWQPGILDPVLRLIADDAIDTSLIVGPGATSVLAPYDGGMDVFVEPARRESLRERYRSWLSPRADGL